MDLKNKQFVEFLLCTYIPEDIPRGYLGDTAMYKNIPIKYSEKVREYFKAQGVKVRFKYPSSKLESDRFSVYYNG